MTALQRADCQAVRERRVLGPSLCTVLGLNKAQIQERGRDMVWVLDSGWRYGLVPDRNAGLDIGLCQSPWLDTAEDPGMNWGWVRVRGRSESLGLGWT